MGCGANREETERTKCPIVAKPARMGHPSVTGLWLACIIVAIVVVAPSRFSISKPCIQVAKLCVLRFAKDIFVGKNPPSVQTFPPLLAALNPFHFGIVHKVFDHWTNCDVLTRADDGGPLHDIGKGEREIFWQRDWQYRRICSERNFMGGRKPGIDHGRDGLKFQVLRSLLIDRTTDDNADIRTHLLAYGRDASSSSLRANCNLLGNRFHGGGCSLGLFDGLLHRLGLLKGSLGTSTDMAGDFFHCRGRAVCFRDGAFHSFGLLASSFHGLPQSSSLKAKDNQLEKPNSSKNPCNDDKVKSEFDEVPIICRFILAILGVLCGFFLSLLGWNCFDNKRRLLGAALVSTGWPLGALGFLLLWLTSFPSTWHWIL